MVGLFDRKGKKRYTKTRTGKAPEKALLGQITS
jgi:hypothetical protein